MPIIINDFEIVVEPKPTTKDSQSEGTRRKDSFTAPTQLRPEDIEHIMRRFMQRHKRLQAD